MLSYLAFIHHGIETIGNPLTDGKTLAHRCVEKLEKLGDKKQFPPRLLILLASPAYLDGQKPEQLLNGVLQGFNDRETPGVELIGCSVAAVFFGRRIHREGALLICLASRLLSAKVGASPDASHNPDEAVKSLLHKLDFYTAEGEEKHSFANRTLFVLFPGFGGNKYLAPELHESLRIRLGARVSIFGGVASANDPQRVRSGILFANQKVHRNAVVAASIECGTPLGISLTHGLTDMREVLNVAELDSQDRRIIRRFREGAVVDEMTKLRKHSPIPLFTNLALDCEPTVDTPLVEKGGVRLTREVRENEPLHIVIPEPEKLQKAFRKGIKRSLQRAWLLNPIAGLGLRCTGLLRHSKEIGLPLEHESALIEHDLSRLGNPIEKPFVGGFVDGEAGLDKNGKSILGNWSSSTLVFGDELRFRTPVYRGFEKLADFAGKKAAETYDLGIDRLTQLVYDIGFPGALLSFCLHDHEKTTIVGQSASGSRYQRLLDKGEPYSLDSDDVLADVVRAKQPLPIIDSRKEGCGSMKAAADEGIVSQYIIPLTGIDAEVNAVLQIDLGDISYDTGLFETEKIVLDWLGKIVNSGMNSTFSWEESKIITKLDHAMKTCLSAETMKQGLQQYLKHTLEAFNCEMGNIRIAREDKHCLSRVAGIGGRVFEATQTRRRDIDFGDRSPAAQAFRNEKTMIINDARNSDDHLEACQQWEDEDKELGGELRNIRSCANVPFRSERGERGTINLFSLKPWSFTGFHESVLEVLGDRVGFLLETLRRKEGESFLTGVSPQLSRIPNLTDFTGVLTNEIGEFAQTAKAEIASLYLWEEGRQRYVLRAQYGWDTKDEWVNAAYYTKNEFWTGTSAIAGVPRHIPDLNEYYEKYFKSGAYPDKTRLYIEYAFGKKLSSEFTFEAIGLQLRIADSERLGVLTLYRPINPGSESGFVTTETELLQKGADNFAGLIGILQTRRKENWEKQERDRRQKVYDATILAVDTDLFEPPVCRQVLEAYSAVKTHFHKVAADGKVTPRVSFEWDSNTGKLRESMNEPDQLVENTVQANRQFEREIKFERVRLEPGDLEKPKRVAVANRISRACIPLVSEKILVGILDIHWSLYDKPADLPDYEEDQSFLRMLGEVIGSAYGRAETKKQAELKLREGEAKLDQGKTKLLENEQINSVAFQTTNAYVMQTEHELRGMLTDMVAMLYSVKSEINEGAEEKARQLIEELLEQVRESNRTLSNLIQIGARMFAPAKEIVSVKKLISQVMAKERKRCERLKIKVIELEIPTDTSVDVDLVLLDSAINNILDNAIKYMQNRERRELTIGATTSFDAGTVMISIKDTGPGMTWNKRKKVLKGFVPHKGRVSAGVPITKLILWIFDGSLDYLDRDGATGTEAVITLPLQYTEKTL